MSTTACISGFVTCQDVDGISVIFQLSFSVFEHVQISMDSTEYYSGVGITNMNEFGIIKSVTYH